MDNNKRNYDLDRPVADILSELGYRVRFAASVRVGTVLSRLADRVWAWGPSRETGLRVRIWNRAVDVTGWARDAWVSLEAKVL